jgi:hypothetical protein
VGNWGSLWQAGAAGTDRQHPTNRNAASILDAKFKIFTRLNVALIHVASSNTPAKIYVQYIRILKQ